MRNSLTRLLVTTLPLIAVAATAHAAQDKSYVREAGGPGFTCADIQNACATINQALANTNPVARMKSRTSLITLDLMS